MIGTIKYHSWYICQPLHKPDLLHKMFIENSFMISQLTLLFFFRVKSIRLGLLVEDRKISLKLRCELCDFIYLGIPSVSLTKVCKEMTKMENNQTKIIEKIAHICQSYHGD